MTPQNGFANPSRWLNWLDLLFGWNRQKGIICLLLFVLAGGLHWTLYHLAPQNISYWAALGNGVGLLPGTLFVMGTLVIPIYVLASLVYTTARTRPTAAYLQLSWRTLLLIPAFFIGVLLHNFIYALFYDHFSAYGGDEAVFFIVSLLLLPAYFLISVGYTWFTYNEEGPQL